jgi:hypothetical protein
MFAALLDTSVLWPSLQRDFLLSLAVEGLHRPLWSTAILDELSHHEAQKLIGRGHDPVLADKRSQRLVDHMNEAFDDAIVMNWESLEGTFGLPDVDDEHVVAAALIGGADVIVTSNLKDFPPQQIAKPLTVISPAQFAADIRPSRKFHTTGPKAPLAVFSRPSALPACPRPGITAIDALQRTAPASWRNFFMLRILYMGGCRDDGTFRC